MKETGRVLWFNAAKGYGFIRSSSQDGSNTDEQDIFVHYSAIQTDGGYRTLEEDQVVEFNIAQGPKGRLALEVVVLS